MASMNVFMAETVVSDPPNSNEAKVRISYIHKALTNEESGCSFLNDTSLINYIFCLIDLVKTERNKRRGGDPLGLFVGERRGRKGEGKQLTISRSAVANGTSSIFVAQPAQTLAFCLNPVPGIQSGTYFKIGNESISQAPGTPPSVRPSNDFSAISICGSFDGRTLMP